MIRIVAVTTFLIGLVLAFYSYTRMHWYLVKKGREKSRLYSFNVLLWFDYMEETQKDFGKTGKWIWCFLGAMFVTLSSVLVIAAVDLFFVK